MRDRLARWTRLFLEFALTQGFAQAAGMLSGLIYVRVMPVDQYALYALSLGSLSFVSLGSDLGLTGSLGYFWRQSGQSESAIETKITAVRRLRSAFLAAAAIIAGVMLYQTATHQQVAPASVLGCFALIVMTVWSQTHAMIDIQLMRLRGRQRQSYYCDVAGSLARMMAAGAMIVTGVTTAWFGLAGGLLGSLTILAAVQSMTGPPGRGSGTIDRETWREIARYLVPMLPGIAVFMVQDPLILWFAATYGGQTPVAETFAAGRPAAVLALLGNFIVIVVAPRLAGLKDDAHFARMVAYLLAALGLASLAVVVFAYVAPSVPLLLIGHRYAHLEKEVVIALITASFNVLIALLAIANRLRGWVRLEPVAAAYQLTAIIVTTRLWSYHDARSILLLSLTLVAFNFASYFSMSLLGLLRPALVKAR